MPAKLINRVQSTVPANNHPYMNGPWTPNMDEYDASDLEVIGKVPDDIDGVYVRNTENPVHAPIGRYHPFDGDGMVHSMRFHNGTATYRNRFVRTRGFIAEQEAGHALWAGLMEDPRKGLRPGGCAQGGLKDSSSTDVVVHAGQILSTFYQCGEGYRLDPYTLEQNGCASWVPIDGISAHTKVDEATGELLFFNYSKHPPYMHYGVVDKSDRLVHMIPVPLPGPRLPHDMAFTENYAILNDLPLFWDEELLKKGIHVVRFHAHLPTRFAIVPRRGKTEDIRWFESAPTYVLHWLNAYEEGDEIVLDGYFEEDPQPKSPTDAPEGYERMMAYLDQELLKPRLHRWRFNLKTGKTTEKHLDPRDLEFGMFNQRYAGRKYRYAYSTIPKPGWFLFTGLVKHDLDTGASTQFDFGPDRYGSESPFAPRLGAKDEDDGYLISYITDMKTNRSECAVIDAKNIAAGPVCRIFLPHRISSGTHATWASAADIEAGRNAVAARMMREAAE